jgi:hypothetical protein
MSRTARPLTKDEIKQANREKYPERLTTRFKAHLVIYVVVNLFFACYRVSDSPGSGLVAVLDHPVSLGAGPILALCDHAHRVYCVTKSVDCGALLAFFPEHKALR